MGSISRREFLAAFPAVQTRLAAGRGQQFPSEIKRYPDPLTEREVWRLTGLARPHHLPYGYQQFIAHNNSFLMLAGVRAEGEAPQVLRLDLPSGRLTQLSQGAGVAPYSICLAPDEKSFFYLQQGVLKQMVLRTLKEREIYRAEDDWWATGDLGISVDGRYASLIEMRNADRVEDKGSDDWMRLQFERKPLCRVRVVETLKGKSWIVAEDKAWLARPQIRPRRDQVLYCHKGPWDRLTTRLWLVNLDGKQKYNVRPRQEGEELGPEYWTGDGKLLGYAHYWDGGRHKATVRAFNPDTRQEQVLSPCTQFWHLRGNRDNSAVVGASRSKAGPNIYVLFPLTQRELTVCEHASSGKRGATTRPVFSADSQWVYFGSDRDGTPALYRVAVSDLVEKT